MANSVSPGADATTLETGKYATGPAPKKHDPVNQPSKLVEGGSGEIVSK